MRHECCYHNCPRGGVLHIGANGGDSHWICFCHLAPHTGKTRFVRWAVTADDLPLNWKDAQARL